ncbi:iron uptake cluster protein [Wolfiporia cocos MD-104 SS10]|uniref:Iron uptake cluster protein n=1 Tax=Wolfiporia cocos (strain MD-104) TaxID=742152 RepID=A0A2H3IYU9_WOLCO|nr:iron uptake cluster protein [Wolfiporia cocos MD-104 SS10]
MSKTVAVLGASYGGAHAAKLLAQGLPAGWKVVVVDRNTHMNHLYVLPRYAVVSGHEYKAFIPYGPLLRGATASKPDASVVFLHANVTSLSPRSITLSRAFPEHGVDDTTHTLRFDYAVYALGSHLPAPIDLWGPVGDEQDVAALTVGADHESTADKANASHSSSNPLERAAITRGTKPEGIEWLKRFRRRVEKASSVLVVGGGALGVQYATDIAEVYPHKRVTLLHSRKQLMPRFSERLHSEIVSSLSELKITTILGDRLDLSSIKAGKTTQGPDGKEERVVRTLSGHEISAELILLCTGQNLNTDLVAQAIPDAVIPDGSKKGLIRVKRTMQVAVPSNPAAPDMPVDSAKGSGDEHLHVPHPHLFAIGDAADAFGAMNSGRSSYFQLINRSEILRTHGKAEGQADSSSDDLEQYTPGPPMIKITLGLTKQLYEVDGEVGTKMDGTPDLEAHRMWEFYGVETDGDKMYE